MDSNYWKNAYQDTWDMSSKRENAIIKWIADTTGLTAKSIGLGAGTKDFISGSADENGHQKGDADLLVVGTNIYIEVTGPLSKSVSPDSPLWLRPDKFENAGMNIQNGHDTFFVHHCPSAKLWRVIHMDEALFQRYQNGAFPIVTPTIRGRKETYVAVPSDDPCVLPLCHLKQYLSNIKSSM